MNTVIHQNREKYYITSRGVEMQIAGSWVVLRIVKCHVQHDVLSCAKLLKRSIN